MSGHIVWQIFENKHVVSTLYYKNASHNLKERKTGKKIRKSEIQIKQKKYARSKEWSVLHEKGSRLRRRNQCNAQGKRKMEPSKKFTTRNEKKLTEKIQD